LRDFLLKSDSIIDAAVEFIVQHSTDPVPSQTKQSLDIRKVKASRAEDMQQAPADVEELAKVMVENGQRLSAINKEHKDARREIVDAKSKAEQSLVQHMDEMPAGSLQCVSLRDSKGNVETYYLRVKPPRKHAKRKISVLMYSKMLHKQIMKETKEQNLTGEAAINFICDPIIGARMCTIVKSFLEDKERGQTDLTRRIALDRVRAPRA
jgi:hypothetical protein